MRYDSLWDKVVGMLSEASHLQHLGMGYMIKRSALSEAKARRDCDLLHHFNNLSDDHIVAITSDWGHVSDAVSVFVFFQTVAPSKSIET